MEPALRSIAPPLASCRLSVAIPARNEEDLLPAALRAFAAQTTLDGRPLPAGLFDIIIFANGCSDATVDVARAFAALHPSLPISVVAGDLPDGAATVGMARKLVMDLAARRLMRAGVPRGVVATTDADTCVDGDWVANVLAEIAAVDAVAGHVTIAETELATLLVSARRLYSRERAYRRVFAEVSNALDPLSYDPAPRHSSFVGAGFAVTAQAYLAAGGVPPLAVLEDRAFFEALCRIDARVRHSLRVRAQTSARRVARVDGGFGSFVDDLHRRALSGQTFAVQHPQQTLDEIELRGLLRRIWLGDDDDAATERVESLVGAPAAIWMPLLDRALTFGVAFDAVRYLAPPRYEEPVAVESAIAALGDAVAALKAPSATRIAAASGAG